MKDVVTKSVFATLNDINVNGHVEVKDTGRVKLSYLSWAWAWAEVKKLYPDADYKIYENTDGWFYHTDGRTCWVKTGVTINGLEHIEYLPVMDNRNSSIPLEKVTSFDVNKAIQRSLTKAAARHGLGLYIYAGEDLPESSLDELLKKIDNANTVEELTGIWNDNKTLKLNSDFSEAVAKKGKELKNGKNQAQAEQRLL